MCRPSIGCAALAPLPWHSNDYSADRHRALGFHDVGLLKRTSVSPGPELTPRSTATPRIHFESSVPRCNYCSLDMRTQGPSRRHLLCTCRQSTIAL
jgi:hypothetical protein